MQTPGEKPVKSNPGLPGKIAALAAVAALAVLLQGCSGSVPVGVFTSPDATLVSIKISPTTPFVLLAGSRQLFATGIYSDGTQQDISSQVTWSASTVASGGGSGTTPTAVSLTSAGLVTGMNLGSSIITATMGPVVGAFQLIVATNGYSSNTVGILPANFGSTEVDAAYLPLSQNLVQGVNVVQVVNLDADQFSSVIPVPAALLASVPMPAGFVPNATAASQNSMKVAVISYTSPDVQVIDANIDPTDPLVNTVMATFVAPVSSSVTFNGITCMICAAVVIPATATSSSSDQLLLSTAEGYFTMDLSAGTFTALASSPSSTLQAPNFALNPLATPPYILSSNPNSGEVQILTLNLAANTLTVAPNAPFGLTAPNASALDVSTSFSAITDASIVAKDQDLVDFTSPLSPLSITYPTLGFCQSEAPPFNMVAVGVSANDVATDAVHTLLLSQTAGNCIGFELPVLPGANPPFPANTVYGYGTLPPTPDMKPFVNGGDPNAIATFNSIVDKKNYGLLVDANQNWIAKIAFANVVSNIPATDFVDSNPPPSTADISAFIQTGSQAPPNDVVVIYLPTPASVVTLSQTSIDFLNQPVGTSSGQSLVNLTNVGANPINISSIVIQGPNASDFTEMDLCPGVLPAQGKCTINVTFTPTATGQRSAVLAVTDDGGASPQTVALTGTGT